MLAFHLRPFRPLVSLAACVSLAPAGLATTLTFDIDGISNFQDISDDYGDRVAAANDPANGFSYGIGAEGTTPNVVVTYTGPGSPDPSLWLTGYGDLTNILFENTDNDGKLDVVLTADPGYAVELLGFDMAAFSSAFTADPSINAVRVTGPGGVLFESLNAVISETTRTTFDFTASPLQGSAITLSFDSANLGGLSDDIAFDNIRFGQVVVPEPATLVVAGLGGLALLGRRRRA